MSIFTESDLLELSYKRQFKKLDDLFEKHPFFAFVEDSEYVSFYIKRPNHGGDVGFKYSTCLTKTLEDVIDKDKEFDLYISEILKGYPVSLLNEYIQKAKNLHYSEK